MRFSVCRIIFCLLSGMVFLPCGVGAQQAEDIDRLRANILALDRIQNNIHREIAARQEAGTISLQERNELIIFTGYLRERNREYCSRIVQQTGQSAVADLPCPAERAALPETKARTVEEELAALDESLAQSLGAFDEMLLKEQERVAARQPRARESGDGGGGGGYEDGSGRAGAKGEIDDSAAGEGASGSQSTSGQGRASASGTAAAGKPGQTGGQVGAVSSAGGDRLNTDDDIVARQLREAAEKETDPELKEKLWQEYRKYKEEL